jgi:hypothetical protein
LESALVRNILGVPVSDATLEAWRKIFVFEHEPFFLESPLPDLPTMTRTEFGDWSKTQSLEYLDACTPWSVPARARNVTLLKPEKFSRLSVSTRPALNHAQVEFKRGSVYPLEIAQRFGILEQYLERDTINDHFILRFDAWNALSKTIQFDWLEWFVGSDGLTGLESDHFLVGFSAVSGPNCFGATLAAVHPDTDRALEIAQTWLHQPEFFSHLESLGYTTPHPWDGSPLLPRAILLFKQPGGDFVHAAAHLEHGLMLNKDAQSWHRPRQVLRLEDLLERWREDGLELWAMVKG